MEISVVRNSKFRMIKLSRSMMKLVVLALAMIFLTAQARAVEPDPCQLALDLGDKVSSSVPNVSSFFVTGAENSFHFQKIGTPNNWKFTGAREDRFRGLATWTFSILGESLSSQLGFYRDSRWIYWPRAYYLNQQLDILSARIQDTPLDKSSPSLNRIRYKEYSGPGALNDAEYLTDFFNKGLLPRATSGELAFHDVNYHGLVPMIPSFTFDPLYREMKWLYDFSRQLENLDSRFRAFRQNSDQMLSMRIDVLTGLLPLALVPNIDHRFLKPSLPFDETYLDVFEDIEFQVYAGLTVEGFLRQRIERAFPFDLLLKMKALEQLEEFLKTKKQSERRALPVRSLKEYTEGIRQNIEALKLKFP